MVTTSLAFISAITAAISAIISARLMFIANRTLKRHHESLRREKAVELLLHWNTVLDQKSSLARKYVEELNKSQAKQLCNQEEIVFDASCQKLFSKIKILLGANGNPEPKLTGNDSPQLKLTTTECTELRWIIIKYLNELEVILTARRNNIADKDIIDENFSYLIRDSKILEDFRMAAGGDKVYPSIALFYKEMDVKSKNEVFIKEAL